jgi:hypothetical protein
MTPRPTKNLLRAFLFAAVSVSLSLPLAPRASTPRRAARPTPRQASEQEKERPLRRPGIVKRLGRTILDSFLTCNDANIKKRRELLDYGPQFPDSYDDSDFYFYALVDSNWPMAVEYELERQAAAVITIEVKGASPFTQTLDGEGMGQRQATQFTLPVYSGKGPHPARISFKATRDGSSGKERAEFRFVGAGAGEGAMAALPKGPSGIEVAALGRLPLGGAGRGPAPPQCALGVCNTRLTATPGGYVYAFTVGSKSKFNKWAADILESVRTGNSDFSRQVRNIKTVAQRIGPNETKTGSWDGLNNRRRRVRPGRYSLLVKAWFSAYNAGRWNAQRDSDPIPIN